MQTTWNPQTALHEKPTWLYKGCYFWKLLLVNTVRLCIKCKLRLYHAMQEPYRHQPKLIWGGLRQSGNVCYGLTGPYFKCCGENMDVIEERGKGPFRLWPETPDGSSKKGKARMGNNSAFKTLTESVIKRRGDVTQW